MEKEIYTEDDIKLAVNIFQRAIEAFNIPPQPNSAEEAQYVVRKNGTIDTDLVPRRTIRTFPNGYKVLHFIYFYDDIYTVEADYNPTIAILGFIDSAREQIKITFPNFSEKENEEWIEKETYLMTLLLISKVYQRMDLALRNYTDEVITNWQIGFFKRLKNINDKQGIKSPSVPEKTYFRNLIKSYENDVVNLWFDTSDEGQKAAKMQFAQDYPSILNHWQKLRKEYTDGNQDWREYAKAGKFFDTPDDLINELEDCKNISHLALEHTGRRVGLCNPDAKPKYLEMRKKGIQATGYSARQLQNIKNEGQEMSREMEK